MTNTQQLPKTPAESLAWNVAVLDRRIADLEALNPNLADVARIAKQRASENFSGEAYEYEVLRLIGVLVGAIIGLQDAAQ